MSLWLLTIFACGLTSPTSPVLTTPSQTGPATAPEARTVTAIALARNPIAIDKLALPYSNRPKKEAAPAKFGLIAPLVYRGRHGEADLYATPLPIHSNLMPTKVEGTHSFGSAPPPGLRVTFGKKYLNFARGGEAPNTYGFSRDELLIGLPNGSPAPDWKDVSISFPKATTHENKLNLGKSKGARAFASRSLTLDAISYTGLYLPAPATASWNITLPERAVLTFRGTIIPPAIRAVERYCSRRGR